MNALIKDIPVGDIHKYLVVCSHGNLYAYSGSSASKLHHKSFSFGSHQASRLHCNLAFNKIAWSQYILAFHNRFFLIVVYAR